MNKAIGQDGPLRALGAMSGTSLDGVDADVVETDGHRIFGFGETGYRAYDAGERAVLRLSRELRGAGLTVELIYKGGLKRGLKRADRINAAAAVMVGDDELAKASATVRNLDSGEQQDVALAELKDHLAAYR